jgi:hypothetical protein
MQVIDTELYEKMPSIIPTLSNAVDPRPTFSSTNPVFLQSDSSSTGGAFFYCIGNPPRYALLVNTLFKLRGAFVELLHCKSDMIQTFK